MRLRRFGRLGVVAPLLLLLGLAAAGLTRAGAEPLKPGAEVFAVDPVRVMEVTYRSAGVMLLAHRWDPGARFTLMFLKEPDSRPTACAAGPGFAAVLSQITSLKLRRALSPKEARELLAKTPTRDWAEITIRDTSALAPFQARLLPVAGAADEALVQFDGATYVVAFSHQVFQLLAGGCATLSGPAPRRP